MQRSSLSVIKLSGTPCEVALDLGRLRCHQIEKRVLAWDQMLAKLYRGKKAELKRLEEGFWNAALAQAPHYLEEIRAMAEGAGVAVRDLFRLNCTELNAFAEKCTTLVLPVTTPEGNRVLIAHNEDWNHKRNDVFVLKVKLPQVSYAILTYDGYLPGLSCGYNSWGLYHAVNYLRPKDRRVGLPRIFITRHLVTATGFEDVLDWVHKSRRAFGQSIHLAMGGEYRGLELTAKQIVERKLRLPIAHANHYLEPAFKKIAAPASPSSLKRQEVADTLLAKSKIARPFTPVQAKKLAKTILSDRSEHPFCIWRDADDPRDESATVATAIMLTGQNQFEIFRKQPKNSSALREKLPR